jgi:hypothetical protein
MIYTDSCLKVVEDKIYANLRLKVIRRMDGSVISGANTEWSVNEAMKILTIPRIKLAVINRIDEISIMEIALLNFMCKPILVTNKAIREYEILSKTVDHIDLDCSLLTEQNNFISWYRRENGLSDKGC